MAYVGGKPDAVLGLLFFRRNTQLPAVATETGETADRTWRLEMESCFFRLVTALLLVPGVALGCTELADAPQQSSVNESSIQGDAGQSPAPGAAGSGANAESDAVGLRDAGTSQAPNPSASNALFEPFEVPLGQSVTVGAFVLQLPAARIEPLASSADTSKTVIAPFATVRIDFTAHNATTAVKTPFADLDDDGIMLEAAGKFFFGTVDAEPVPGLRDGMGTVSWVIKDAAAIASVRSAIVTFGEAEQNKVVIPFADPSATVTLADVAAQGPFTITGYRHTTLDFSDVHVRYNSRGSNEPLKDGTGYLVLTGVISADPGLSQYGEYWDEVDVFVERPDGVSVVPADFHEDIRPGDRVDVTIMFDITWPATGTYTFGVRHADLASVTHQIVVP